MVATIATLGGSAVLGPKFVKWVVSAWQLFRKAKADALAEQRQAQEELHATQGHLVDGFRQVSSLTERERDQALQECEDLREQLCASVRKLDVRDDINRQDRATIRSLRATIRLLRFQVHAFRLLAIQSRMDDAEIADVPRITEEADEG